MACGQYVDHMPIGRVPFSLFPSCAADLGLFQHSTSFTAQSCMTKKVKSQALGCTIVSLFWRVLAARFLQLILDIHYCY